MQVVRVNMRQNQEDLKELAVNSDWREDHQEEMISMRDLAKQRPNVVVSCCHLLSTLVTLKKLCKHWSAAFILRNPDGVFLMARHDRKGPINKVPNRKDVSRWQVPLEFIVWFWFWFTYLKHISKNSISPWQGMLLKCSISRVSQRWFQEAKTN